MINLPVMRTKAVDYGVQDYSRSIRSAVHALWADSIDYFSFVDSLVLAIHRGLTRAFYEGLKMYGISPNEMTAEERNALSLEINTDIASVMGFADVVAANKRADKNLIGPLYKRAELWANRYDAIRSMAMMFAAKDQKMRWEIGPCKEHCPTCTLLSGRVYRGSTWKKYNIYPRMRRLDCKGFRCCCKFVQTTDPCTPGRPPAI